MRIIRCKVSLVNSLPAQCHGLLHMNSSQCLSEFLDQSAKVIQLKKMESLCCLKEQLVRTNDVTVFKTINTGLKLPTFS